MLSVLLLQARVSMGKAFHPFLRKNESGALTANFEKTVQGPSISMHHSVFGDNWAMDFGDGGNGCESGRGSFMWRGQGFGSNINSESATQESFRSPKISSVGQHHPV